jgi:hypothetical protein
MTRRVVGLDLSLTSLGYAWADGTEHSECAVKAKLSGHRRLKLLTDAVRAGTEGAVLVVVEGPSYGSQAGQRGHHERAGLWWMVTHDLWLHKIPTAIVPPSVLKSYATGVGNAAKDAVLVAACKRFPAFADSGGNDAADALWLAAMGADHLGAPLVTMPAANRAALAKVDWPEVTR